MAEKVWNAQADVSMSATHFRSTYGDNALSWLRAAETAAGAKVTTGTITVLADGSTRHAAGGTTLRLARPGYSGELRVDSLTGDVMSADFPRAGDSIDVTWLFSNGKSARCVLEHDEAQFLGTFADEHGDEAQVRISWSRSVTTHNYPDSTVGFATEDSIGEHIYADGRKLNYALHGDYSSCLTASQGCSIAQIDFRNEHEVLLRLDNSTWNLKYVTGWKQQTTGSTIIKYWGGSIDGPVAGALVVRPVAPVFGLDVNLGGDTFNVDAAQAVAQ